MQAPQSLTLEELDYRLTTMPARPILFWSGIGILAGVTISYLIMRGVAWPVVVGFTTAGTTILDILIIAFANMIWAVFIYHTVHQLLMINRIYTTCTKIDLFRLSPLYAFSKLTARTSFGWLALVYAWLSVLNYTDPLTIAFNLPIILLCIATFIWPLLGIHRLLEEEKARVKTEINMRLKTSMDDLHQHVDHRRYADTVPLADTITGLKQALEIVEKIPTWPWQPETLRAVITAVLLPLALWLLTRTLERLLLL